MTCKNCGYFDDHNNEVMLDLCPLHAAAPDLLAACKEALTCMEYECSPRSTRELLASAIAKAEGKA